MRGETVEQMRRRRRREWILTLVVFLSVTVILVLGALSCATRTSTSRPDGEAIKKCGWNAAWWTDKTGTIRCGEAPVQGGQSTR